MTANEIEMLLCGISIGAQGMALCHMVLDLRDVQRDLARSRQARRRAAADHYFNSLSLYQLQTRREPHPAEVVEAAVRDFELTLRDAIDRVDDAARREGLQ
ncbi:hypothetical protein ACFW88_00245 [Streptomyces anandii]|uniref:Uncharacterized protein n=1 Tax=Streptomyces anandii TaxID=285454 RepID=A0ABW6GX96_9ACTN